MGKPSAKVTARLKNITRGGLLNIFSVLFLVILAFWTLSVIIFPKNGVFTPITWLVLPLILVFLASIFLAPSLINKLKLPSIPRTIQNLLLVLLFLILFIVHLYIGLSLRADILGWDPAVVHDQASRLASGSETNHNNYFAGYTNNLGILALLTAFFKTLLAFNVTNLAVASIGLNVLMMELAVVLIFLVCQKIYGRKIALLSLIPSTILITLSLWTNTTYTDTLTLLFPVLVFLITLYIHDTKRLLVKLILSIIIGMCLAVGFLLKPTVIILPIAIIVVAILLSLKTYRKDKKEFKANLLSLSVASITFVTSYFALLLIIGAMSVVTFNPLTGSPTERPLHHWAMIGLKVSYRDYERPLYGAYSLEDDLRTAGKSPDEAKAIATRTILDRLSDYGVGGYLGFLNDKAVWILSDGTFYAYGEGIAYEGTITSYKDDSKGAEYVRSVFDNHGKYYPLLTNLQHAIWITLLILISIQLLFIRDKLPYWLYILYIGIAGIILFILIFEGRSRYLYSYIPLFIITSLYAVHAFLNRPTDKDRRSQKPKANAS